MKTPTEKKARKPRAAAPADESKRDKFVRLVTARVSKAITTVDIVGNLANRNNYEFGETDVKAIIAALDESVEKIVAKFQHALSGPASASKAKTAFVLPTAMPAVTDGQAKS